MAFGEHSQRRRSQLRTLDGHLKQLEWLIGEWVDESDDSTMRTSTRWSEDGHFILTDFTIFVAGHNAISGTQRIGWHGSLDRSARWALDSEGGHAEGIWTDIDDRWIVTLTGVRPDGTASSATNAYDLIRPDVHTFSVTSESSPMTRSPTFRRPSSKDHPNRKPLFRVRRAVNEQFVGRLTWSRRARAQSIPLG